MSTKQIEFHGRLPLPSVLLELVTKLNADDWARWATEDGGSFYYILGMQAHIAEEMGGPDHTVLSVGSGRPVSVVGEHQVHAQVASLRTGDYFVRQARNRLEAAGIQSSQIDRFLDSLDKGELSGDALEGWNITMPNTDRLDAFSNLLHALAIRRGVAVGELATDVERERELSVALEKVHLDQLSRLLGALLGGPAPWKPSYSMTDS